jgi:hypothetical protein
MSYDLLHRCVFVCICKRVTLGDELTINVQVRINVTFRAMRIASHFCFTLKAIQIHSVNHVARVALQPAPSALLYIDRIACDGTQTYLSRSTPHHPWVQWAALHVAPDRLQRQRHACCGAALGRVATRAQGLALATYSTLSARTPAHVSVVTCVA